MRIASVQGIEGVSRYSLALWHGQNLTSGWVIPTALYLPLQEHVLISPKALAAKIRQLAHVQLRYLSVKFQVAAILTCPAAYTLQKSVRQNRPPYIRKAYELKTIQAAVLWRVCPQPPIIFADHCGRAVPSAYQSTQTG